MAEGGRYVVAVGSNIEPRTNLPAALARLRDRAAVECVSSVWETAPVGAPGTPAFYNAAVVIGSELPPARLKFEVLRPVEAALGRSRGSDLNAPRPIDLDLVLWSGGALEDRAAGLRLPDPDVGRLAHLALPVSEVAPEWLEPASGRPLAAIAAELGGRARRVELPAWDAGGAPAPVTAS